MVRESQGELFEEFSKLERVGKQKTSIKRFARRILPRKRKRIIQFSLESCAFISIVIILGFIILYSLGFENGKKIANKNLAEKTTKENIKKDMYVTGKNSKLADRHGQDILDENEDNNENAKEDEYVHDWEKPYTIQVISFKVERRAEAKVKALEKLGYEAMIIPSGAWYQVCVGSYLSEKEAEEDLGRLKTRYRDCYVRIKE